MSKAPQRKARGWPAVLLVVLWRFVWGKHLDGKRRSDASLFRPGTTADPNWWWRGGESKWALLPAWKRAVARLLPILVGVGWITHRAATEWGLALTVAPLTGLWLAAGVRSVNDFGHYRSKIRPAHQALAPMFGIPDSTPPRSWLTIPHDYLTRPGAEISIRPAAGFVASSRLKADVLHAVQTKLAIEAEADWDLSGSRPEVTIRRSEPPPDYVSLADIMPYISAGSSDAAVLGLGKKAQPVVVTYGDTPHVGLSMSTGDGKSATARNIAAQHLYHGGLLVVLDYKLISHMWARGLPNVAYAGTYEDIELMLNWLAKEVQRRKEVGLAGADVEGDVHADVGPPILAILEELNATQNRLRAWWQREKSGKGRSPGSDAADEVLFMGRQVLMRELQIAQRLSVRASGSGDGRENIGTLIFKDPTPAAWKMLASQHAMPAASGHNGRLQVVTRKEVRVVQGAYMTGAEARSLALSGTIAVPRSDMPCLTSIGPRTVPELQNPGPDQAIVLGQPRFVPGAPNAVTLREAAEAGLFTSVPAARKAAQRHGFRVVGERDRANLYDLSDLHAHIARRTR